MSTAETSARVLVWDASIRVLHFAFAGGLAVALAIGFGVDDEHPLFALHGLAGLLAGGALVLRVVLGFAGPRHVRFTDWPLGLGELRRHLLGMLPGQAAPSYVRHNPLAAWTMLALYGVAAGLLASGLAGGEDPHEGLAVALGLLVAAHLAGIAVHTLRHRENVAWSMVDGRRRAPHEAALAHAGLLRGGLVGALLLGWAALLGRGFDSAAGTVSLPGGTVALREAGDVVGGHGGERHRGHHKDDEDDD